MNIEQLKSSIPDYAKDIRLNLGSLLSNTESVKLSLLQIAGMALASAYATHQQEVIQSLEAYTREVGLEETTLTAIKGATAIMGMNNIYYRSIHLMSDKSYTGLSAKLRMSIMANPGIDKQDFEWYCFMVSVVNGCSQCLDSHRSSLLRSSISQSEIHYAIRLASVICAFAQVMTIEAICS